MGLIYLAGKIAKNDWRHEVVAGLRGTMQLGAPFPRQWPVLPRAVEGLLDYAGPYPMGCDHGCGHNAPHASVWGVCGEASGTLDQAETQRLCFDAIRRTDLFFAWLDDPTAYGTLVEIGYAKALGKTIVVASPDPIDDLWFATGCATSPLQASTPSSAIEALTREIRRVRARTDSPIEAAFWQENCRLNLPSLQGLVTQHNVGRYRLDFAIPERKFGIELDGYAYHSDKESFVKDRARQRDLEAQGWRIIRFAGSEITRDVTRCVEQAAHLASPPPIRSHPLAEHEILERELGAKILGP